MNALLKLSGGIDAINRTIGRIFAWILLPMICLTAFEGREKRQCRYFIPRTTPFQNPQLPAVWAVVTALVSKRRRGFLLSAG